MIIMRIVRWGLRFRLVTDIGRCFRNGGLLDHSGEVLPMSLLMSLFRSVVAILRIFLSWRVPSHVRGCLWVFPISPRIHAWHKRKESLTWSHLSDQAILLHFLLSLLAKAKERLLVRILALSVVGYRSFRSIPTGESSGVVRLWL